MLGASGSSSDDVESLGSGVRRRQPVPAADIEGVRSFGWYGAQDHTVVVDVQVPSDLLLLHATETTARPFYAATPEPEPGSAERRLTMSSHRRERLRVANYR